LQIRETKDWLLRLQQLRLQLRLILKAA